MNQPIDKKIVKGMLDTLLLQLLLEQPNHGYALCELLRERSGGTLQIKESSIYTALYRLESARHVTSKEIQGASGRLTRVYEVTGSGKAQLGEGIQQWKMLNDAVGKVLGRENSSNGTGLVHAG